MGGARYRLVSAAVLSAGLLVAAAHAHAHEDDIRTRIGLDMFPRMVALDADLAGKREDTRVLLLIVFQTREVRALAYAELLRHRVGRVGRFPVHVDVAPADRFLGESPPPASAILVVERLSQEHFQALTRYGVARRRIIFSPIEGDVERGVPIGLRIGARIVPQFNLDALSRASIRIPAQVLRLSVEHE